MTIGEKIKQLRLKKGLTQKQLGAICEMADSAIRRYENNRANPKVETIKKIAEALGVDYWEIIGFNDVRINLEDNTSDDNAILKHYNKLNIEGKDEAIKRTEELTYIPKYIDKEE